MHLLVQAFSIGVALASTSMLAAQEDATPKRQAADLASPVHVVAAGESIEVGGFAAPFVGDFDGDGLNDLIVGQSAMGRLRVYRNQGSNTRPEFDKFEWFEAGEQIACVPRCCQIAFTPQLVDFDGDGRTDILTGSGVGGEVFLFRRNVDGAFAAAEVLENSSGQVLLHRCPPHGRARRYNVTALAYDWDEDGDADLLLGYSPLCLVINEGSAEEPRFDNGRLIQCDGRPIRGGVGSPHMADWDGDGLDDLIAGSQGDIVWYRNIGQHAQPKFATPQLLVPLVTRSPSNEVPVGQPGYYHAFCVADFNADGRLDLIVGDRFIRTHKMTDQERQQALANRAQQAELREQYYQMKIAKPQNETSVARIKRYRTMLRTWQQCETLGRSGYKSRGTWNERRGFVWYYQRVEPHDNDK